MPSAEAVPLASLGNRFILGRAIEMTVDAFEQARDVGQRVSATSGSVLGNRIALQSAWPGARSPGAESIAQPPPLGASPQGLGALPPLSMVGGSGLPQPVVSNMPSFPGNWSPGAPSGASVANPSLPGLAPLVGGAPMGAPYASRSPVPQAPAGASRDTQHLSMSMDLLALLGLRELASSLVPNVPLETTGDVARLLTKLHDLIEVFCRGLISLREGYAQFASATDVSRSESRRLNRSPSAIRVEAARDPASLAAALLDWRSQEYDGPQVVEALLVDVVMHHAALVEGVMRGVETLLDELSPEALEEEVKKDGGGVFGRHRALWQAYKSRHQAVSGERRRFELLFGPEFAASYREYIDRQTKSPV